MTEAWPLFHFASPVWLLLLLSLPLLWRRGKAGGVSQPWGFADPHLLPHLRIESAKGQGRAWEPLWAALAGLFLVLALAGPRWEKEAQTVYASESALMIVLDLSASMQAADLAPSRMQRAQADIARLLDAAQARGMKAGLIVFAADAHIAAPVTEDMGLLKELLPSLQPALMSLQGSDPGEALTLAARHLRALTQVTDRHVLLVTDGELFDASSLKASVADWKGGEAPIRLHALLEATEKGAPIPDGGGHYLTERDGRVFLSVPDMAGLQALVAMADGVMLSGDKAEAWLEKLARDGGMRASEEQGVRWKEGYLPFLLTGMVFLVTQACWGRFFLFALLLIPMQAWAVPLRDELSGLRLFEQERYAEAAQALHEGYRQGVAFYRAGDYSAAAKAFGEAKAYFNQGNALFQAGDYQASAEAYRRQLALTPNHAEAAFNLKLAEALLEQEKKKPSDTPSNDPSKKPDAGKGEQPSGGGQESQAPAQPQENPSGGEGQGEGQKPSQPALTSDATLQRMLQQMDSDPGELLQKRIGQEERQQTKKPGHRQNRLPPW